MLAHVIYLVKLWLKKLLKVGLNECLHLFVASHLLVVAVDVFEEQTETVLTTATCLLHLYFPEVSKI